MRGVSATAYFKTLKCEAFGLLLTLSSVEVRTFQSCRELLEEFIWAKMTTFGDARCQMFLENYSFVVFLVFGFVFFFFTHLELGNIRNIV